MAVLTIHHWDAELEPGVRELRRVARGPVVIVTYDPRAEQRDVAAARLPARSRRAGPPDLPAAGAAAGLARRAPRITPLPIPRDTPDWTLGSFWAHPERVLDEQARARRPPASPGWTRRSSTRVVARGASADLDDGTWDARNGALRDLDELDVGMRLVVSPA